MASNKKSQFSVLRSPWITEKSAASGSTDNCVVFEVHTEANKKEIKAAVEKIFDVKVKEVRTLNFKGKQKKTRSHLVKQNDWKKAYVSLAEGNSINLVEDL